MCARSVGFEDAPYAKVLSHLRILIRRETPHAASEPSRPRSKGKGNKNIFNPVNSRIWHVEFPLVVQSSARVCPLLSFRAITCGVPGKATQPMLEPLDIFIKMEDGTYMWKAAADRFEIAKSTVERLATTSPGEYMIFNQATGNKIVVKDGLPEPGVGDVIV